MPRSVASRGDQQDRATTGEHPAPHVLAEVVGPQERALVGERLADDLVLAVRRDPRPDDREEHDERGDDDADHQPALDWSPV